MEQGGELQERRVGGQDGSAAGLGDDKFGPVALELAAPGRLRGRVQGQAGAAERVRTEIKAVTYHDLRLERGPAGVRARVVFDV